MDVKMECRTVKCQREGCTNTAKERVYGEGFDGWQNIQWIQKDGRFIILCPECTKKINDFITGKSKEVG